MARTNSIEMEDEMHREAFPPGTVRLESILGQNRDEIILQPAPTTDPNDPLNWSKLWKTVNFSLVCYYTLIVFVNIDIGTVIYGQLNTELGISFNDEQIAFGFNTAALAIGCILFIPFALKFGRRPIYLVSIFGSVVSAVWQGRVQTAGDLWGANLLAGLAGAISETICQMTIADIFFLHQRGTANGMFLTMENIGVFLGPVAAGYSAASQGWRWIYYWTTILSGICFLLFCFLYEETKYEPVCHGATIAPANTIVTSHPTKTDLKPDEEEGFPELSPYKTDASQVNPNVSRKTYWQRLALCPATPGDWSSFFRHAWQPFVLICTYPAIAYCALIYGSLLAWFSVVVNVYSTYFSLPPYNFSASGIGLLNLPPFIGGILGSIYGGVLNDKLIIHLSRRNGGIFEPEMRLWLALPLIFILPGSLLFFGLSTADGLPWIVPCIGLGLFGFAFFALSSVALTYTMDCYTEIVGDALIGVCFIRNAFATVISCSLTPWIDGVGLKNVFIISAIVSFIFGLTTMPLLIWGKQARTWTADRFTTICQTQVSFR